MAECNGLLIRRTHIAFRGFKSLLLRFPWGRNAAVACLPCKQEVEGSIPFVSTNSGRLVHEELYAVSWDRIALAYQTK